MAVARGGGADEAATRRCRPSEPLPEISLTTVRRLHTPQPALRSGVVLVLLVSGISPSASNTSPASVARSAPTALGDPCTVRRILRLKGGGGSWGRGTAADAKWQGPGQVRSPDVDCPRLGVYASPRAPSSEKRLSATPFLYVAASPLDDARQSWMVCVPPECGGA